MRKKRSPNIFKIRKPTFPASNALAIQTRPRPRESPVTPLKNISPLPPQHLTPHFFPPPLFFPHPRAIV